MFSKTCEYAIRAIIYIAQNADEGHKVSIKAIAKGIGSPEHFIAKILQDLGRKGMVQSIKGPHGGFYLEEELLKGSIADIVRVIDGDKIFVHCGLGLKYCSEVNPCPIHAQYKHIKKDITNMLQKAKLSDFKNGSDNGQLTTYLVNSERSL